LIAAGVDGAAVRARVTEAEVVRAVHGVDLAAAIPGVTAVEVKAYPGKLVTPPLSNHELYGHVVAVADSAAGRPTHRRRAVADISAGRIPFLGKEGGPRVATIDGLGQGGGQMDRR
jgi:L-amino acid ligase C-terminal domain 2